MIRFFQKIRQQLLLDHKLRKYSLYAIGEILLVVFGILIALQINNQNDLRKERIKEIHYLKNIKTDLQINLQEMDKYLDIRTKSITGANRIIAHFEGEPITDYTAFNADGLDFIARLVALVPKPRVNLTRFHGVFAPNSTRRALITPARRGRGRESSPGKQGEEKTPFERRLAMTWAQHLKRVFAIDVETCSECGGDVRVIASIV